MGLLGHGGMGAVYLAADMGDGNRRVAVKENRIASLAGIKQFQIEANILARLQHPNLPRVSAHFLTAGTQYLVMDFVDGEDLNVLVSRVRHLPETQVLGWMRQIMDAVAYLHANRVIHRDIKPANIRVTPQGRAVLVDFGIAKIQTTGQATMLGAHGGTPGFAPPEQFGGGTTPRSDIYSLGATLYFLLTSHDPVDAQLRLRGAPLPRPRLYDPSISPGTERAILHALRLNPRERFQHVSAFQRALSTRAPASSSLGWPMVAVGVAVLFFLMFIGLPSPPPPPPSPTATVVRASAAPPSGAATAQPVRPTNPATPTTVAVDVTETPTSTPTAAPTATRNPGPNANCQFNVSTSGTFYATWRAHVNEIGCPRTPQQLDSTQIGFNEQRFDRGHLFLYNDGAPYFVLITYGTPNEDDRGDGTWEKRDGEAWSGRDEGYCDEANPDPPKNYPVYDIFAKVFCLDKPVQFRLGWGREYDSRKQLQLFGKGNIQKMQLQFFQRGVILRDSDGETHRLVYVLRDNGTYTREPY
ncbi:MAG: serine/threonine protein kinase [Chloroflexi bacterium]|nr:serine/threonine protein kinase [Chloroflexota bacterium]